MTYSHCAVRRISVALLAIGLLLTFFPAAFGQPPSGPQPENFQLIGGEITQALDTTEHDDKPAAGQPETTAPDCPKSWLDRWEDVAKKTRSEGGRWFLGEYDFDNRGFNVLHFMGHSPLPFGFDVWGFIDIEGADLLGANREDFATYFLEIDLKKPIWERAGLIGELNDLQGDNNTIGRFGLFWNPKLPEKKSDGRWFAGDRRIGFKIFPVETDGNGWQASMNWNKKFNNFVDGRFSAGGFVDLNFDAGPTQDDLIIVSEHQIRYRLLEGLHLITEFRINEFLQDDFGIAPGIQYRY